MRTWQEGNLAFPEQVASDSFAISNQWMQTLITWGSSDPASLAFLSKVQYSRERWWRNRLPRYLFLLLQASPWLATNFWSWTLEYGDSGRRVGGEAVLIKGHKMKPPSPLLLLDPRLYFGSTAGVSWTWTIIWNELHKFYILYDYSIWWKDWWNWVWWIQWFHASFSDIFLFNRHTSENIFRENQNIFVEI